MRDPERRAWRYRVAREPVRRKARPPSERILSPMRQLLACARSPPLSREDLVRETAQRPLEPSVKATLDLNIRPDVGGRHQLPSPPKGLLLLSLKPNAHGLG